MLEKRSYKSMNDSQDKSNNKQFADTDKLQRTLNDKMNNILHQDKQLLEFLKDSNIKFWNEKHLSILQGREKDFMTIINRLRENLS